MISERQLSYLLRTPEGLELVKPFFNNRTLDLKTLSPQQFIIITERPEEQNDEDLRDLKMFLDFSRIWDQICRLPRTIKKYQQARQKKQKKQQKNTPTATAKGFSAGAPMVPGASSAMADTQMNDEMGVVMEGDAAVRAVAKDEASKWWTQFMNRLLKRKLCIRQDGGYVLEPTFRRRLVLASLPSEAPWLLPSQSAAPSKSVHTPSAIPSNGLQGNAPPKRPLDEVTARGHSKRRRARRRARHHNFVISRFATYLGCTMKGPLQ